MKLIRVKADYTENKREFILFTLLTDRENKIVTDWEMFGYVVDAGEDGLYTYPFVIKATHKKEVMTLQYGADSEYAMDRVNLIQKELKVGEFSVEIEGTTYLRIDGSWINGIELLEKRKVNKIS